MTIILQRQVLNILAIDEIVQANTFVVGCCISIAAMAC
jgi:hypothetical protein